MALGTLTMLLGMGYSLAFEALVLFILVHSLYKGALFMVAGTLDHETGTRDYRRLGGLGNYMPITAVGADSSNGHIITRSEEHTSELQSRGHLVCRLLLEKKKNSDIRRVG